MKVITKDKDIRYFESARVVIEWADGERIVSFARLPKEITEYTEALDGHGDDPYVYWYTRDTEWSLVENATFGSDLPSEDKFIRHAFEGE